MTAPAVLPTQEPTRAEVTEVLRDVLSRSEFANPEPPPILRWYADARRAIGEFFGRILDRVIEFISGVGDLGAAGPLVRVAIALVAITVIVLLMRAGWIAFRNRERVEHPAGRAGGEEADHTEASVWEQRARSALAEGKLIEAAHALYAALVFRLQDRGVLEAEPSKTPGDYRREARRRDPESARLLDRFVRRFEPFVFGGRPPTSGPLAEMAEVARQGGVDV